AEQRPSPRPEIDGLLTARRGSDLARLHGRTSHPGRRQGNVAVRQLERPCEGHRSGRPPTSDDRPGVLRRRLATEVSEFHGRGVQVRRGDPDSVFRVEIPQGAPPRKHLWRRDELLALLAKSPRRSWMQLKSQRVCPWVDGGWGR